MQLLIGTNNQNKLKQFKFLFSKYAPEIEIFSLSDLNIADNVTEDADNLLDNAKKKAEFYGKKSNMQTLADDTGLFVDALNGEPGIHSNRWHGGTEHDRCLKLVEKLRDVPEKARTARYAGVIAVYNPYLNKFWEFESKCEGVITDYFLGDNGFGYDSIFKVLELNKQYAELSESEKMTVGHRGKGVKKFIDALTKADF